MLEQRFEDFEQQKRRDHKAQDQAQNTKQKRDRLNPPDWSQVTKAGWNMLDAISEKVPRAFRLYSFFAQNIDKSCGAVVCDQKFLADYFGVSLRTIQYWIGDLERIGAIVKIPVGIYYAYALDPYQVWRGYNTVPYTHPTLPTTHSLDIFAVSVPFLKNLAIYYSAGLTPSSSSIRYLYPLFLPCRLPVSSHLLFHSGIYL
ncbi:hypothetical protein, partial [Pseudomonas aeruginosa]|uniref:hypothetical protein n=1 Tax=Pseudomonas aeruginosa TaxID=287 RepID=UPI0018DB78C3